MIREQIFNWDFWNIPYAEYFSEALENAAVALQEIAEKHRAFSNRTVTQSANSVRIEHENGTIFLYTLV